MKSYTEFSNVLHQNLVRDIGHLLLFFFCLEFFLFNHLRNNEKIEQVFKDAYLLIT